MNITIYCRAYPCKKGKDIFFYENDGHFIESIADNFDNVYLLCQIVKDKNDPRYSYASKYTYQFQNQNILFIDRSSKPIKLFKQLKRIAKKTDIYYAMGPSMGSYLSLLSFKKSKKIVYNGIDFYADKLDKLGINNAFEKFILKKSDYVICTGAHLVEKYNKYRANIKSEETKPLLTIQQFINQKSISKQNSDKLRILSLGHFTDRKHQITLIQAAKTLVNKGFSNFEINFVGEGKIKEFKQKHAVLLDDLKKNLIFHGRIQDPEKILEQYTQNDVLCITSLEEGVPRTAYEAMLTKTPIVSTPLPGLTAKFADEKDILYYDFKDADGLANILFNKISDDHTLNTLLENNEQFVKQFFDETPSQQFKRIINII